MSDLIKLGLVLALVVGGWFAWEAHEKAVYDRGYNAAMKLRDAQDAKHLVDDTADALKKEREFAARLAASEAQRLKERDDHAKDKADAVARARAGGSGMRCPSAGLRADAAPTSGTAAGPAGPPEDGRLVPQAAGDILDAIGNGVQDVRDYNDLLVEYHALKTLCEQPPGH